MTDDQIKALISESTKPLTERITAAEGKVTALETENATLKTANARLNETLALGSAKTFVETRLRNINLPAATKQRLAESLPARATLANGKLDEAAFGAIVDQAAKDEAAYLTSVGFGGGVIGMGASVGESAEPKPEEIEKAFTSAIAAFGGLTEAQSALAAKGRAA